MAAGARPPKPMPAVRRVRELLSYNPNTGVFTWRVARAGRPAGAPAGCLARVHSGVRLSFVIGIDGRSCYAQRVAWALMTGAWPENLVAFRDHDPTNLRWTNLMAATTLSNRQRRMDVAPNSLTGVLGVRLQKRKTGPDKFSASIRAGGCMHYLGIFPTEDEARAAYLEAKKRLHSIDVVARVDDKLVTGRAALHPT